ncbi:8246_t:CDS:2, partial [Paraglomus occultum]
MDRPPASSRQPIRTVGGDEIRDIFGRETPRRHCSLKLALKYHQIFIIMRGSGSSNLGTAGDVWY